MNYKSMKSMIDGLVNGFNCPECKAPVNDESVDIIGAAGSTVNLDICCPACNKHTMVKSEVLTIDLSKLSGIKGFGLPQTKITSSNGIKDENIIELNKNLKKLKLNVSDLFTDKK